MFDNDRWNKQTSISDQEIWKDFTVDEFRALRDLVLLLEENEGNVPQEITQESDEMSGLWVQTAQHQNELKTLGSAVKKKSTKFPSLHTISNIWTFLTQTMRDIELSTLRKPRNHNLSRAEELHWTI